MIFTALDLCQFEAPDQLIGRANFSLSKALAGDRNRSITLAI